MTRRVSALALYSTAAAALAVSLTAAAPFTRNALKWPPWLSIESPVNSFDAPSRSAALLVHTSLREGEAQLGDLTGAAEGLVNGARRSVPLHFDATSHPNVFAVRRQWPDGGAWVLRISLKSTTAIIALDRSGSVASTRIPGTQSGNFLLPRVVESRDIDSALAEAARRNVVTR
ncbi:MAG TPA: hypothetical protein VN706_07265 [Gemmatimonadaceae bacterium]|nr:hypothetical protein [Gemmatimonadaceae bacterium]